MWPKSGWTHNMPIKNCLLVLEIAKKLRFQLPTMHIPKLSAMSSRSSSWQDVSASLISTSPIGEVCSKLARNALTELQVGYSVDEFRSKRDVETLERVIKERFFPLANQDKYSNLQSIKIGWRLDRCVLIPMLEQVLPMLLDHPAPVTIRRFQLAVDAWVPEATLRRLVNKNSLVELDLRMTRIRTRCASDSRYNRGSKSLMQSSRLGKLWGGADPAGLLTRTTADRKVSASDSDHRVRDDSHLFKVDLTSGVDDNIIRILPHMSPTITTLRLVDCDLQNHHVKELCSFLRGKRNGPPLEALSLRHNRHLDPDQCLWRELLGIPGLKSLDVSLCDFEVADGVYMANALREQDPNSASLISLNVAGNYRMALAIPKLVGAASRGLVRLDCSFCDCQNEVLDKVFRYLAKKHNGTLQGLILQGSRIQDSTELVNCVRNNVTLKSLVLNHPKGRTEPFPLDVPTLIALGEALEHNYQLQVLSIDCERQYLKHMESWNFWLELNRCGRSRILNENPTSAYKSRLPVLSTPRALALALAKAASLDDKNVLHWLVSHGIGSF
jgi:hypothetical protein